MGGSKETSPFVKWAGGKRLLLPFLREWSPPSDSFVTYHEPFLGGGALFFDLRPQSAFLSDVNGELVETYEAVRGDVERVIDNLRRMKYSEKDYYAIRNKSPRSSAARAARFIYLNKSCFNGLYRVNQAGRFNVPFGRHGPNLVLCDRDQLRKASAALQDAIIRASDFEEAVKECSADDLVYFDPPYTTAHTNNGFVEYNAKVFSWEDQRRLADVASALVKSGVNVMISNAMHESVVRLYLGTDSFRMASLERHSTIAGSSSHRFPTSEVLFVGGPAFQRPGRRNA